MYCYNDDPVQCTVIMLTLYSALLYCWPCTVYYYNVDPVQCTVIKLTLYCTAQATPRTPPARCPRTPRCRRWAVIGPHHVTWPHDHLWLVSCLRPRTTSTAPASGTPWTPWTPPQVSSPALRSTNIAHCAFCSPSVVVWKADGAFAVFQVIWRLFIDD